SRLGVLAARAVCLCVLCTHFRLGLRSAAGDDDARVGPLALQPPDRLPRLRDGLGGDRAAVDDDGIGKARVLRLAPDHLGFKSVETAAKGENVDAHRVIFRLSMLFSENRFTLFRSML